MNVLHANFKIMKQFQDNVETDKVMPPEVAEPLFSTPLTNLYNSLSKLLRNNKVVTEDLVLEQKRISKFFDSIVKV